MKIGIVGLPNVGKSTLFNAITQAGAESANYPFCTIEPNTGVVAVPDGRLEALSAMHNPKKVTPAVVEFVDIAGLVRGASKGEGLGNQFLAHIREVDAILHVVRCFDDENIVHVEGAADPVRDVEIINIELALADCETVERRCDKARKLAKGDKKYESEAEFFERVREALDTGSLRGFEMSGTERALLSGCPLLSAKPVMYVANLDEKSFGDRENNKHVRALRELASRESARVLPICALIEEEISGLEESERGMFLSDLGLTESGLDRIIRESYSLLGLISFLTAGAPEVRAWTIKDGTRAPAAAGKIHSDIERGFIRAEVIGFDELMAAGSPAAAKERGLIRSEGKEYRMRDGDVVLFRFNV